MKGIATLLIACAMLIAVPAAHADGNSAIQARLAKQLGVNPADVTASPIPGLYRITIGPQVAYVSADGRYLVRGDLINLQSGDNLTTQQRDLARLAYLKQLTPADMIVFAPPHPKYTVTVFTDFDCAYCRVLEHDRPALNAMGIVVRYLAFPRDGADSASWRKAEAVWCAPDRQAAFTAAMNGAPVPSAKCGDNAVVAGYHFGELLGLDGTPVMITDRGRLIDGYLPPADLIQVLSAAPTTPH
jgi:thiol:disulfide interchange protein DsbC